MIAANAGSVDTVKLLVEHGADVNAAESKKGQTALMWAAAEGHADVVQALIEHGAAVSAASKAGFTPLVFAAVKDDAKSVRSLITAGADPNFALPDGTKVMLVATGSKSTAAAAALADAGADPNVADRTGNTPLHVAAQMGSVDLVKKLLAKGANPNAKTAQSNFGGRGGAGGGGGFRAPAGQVTPLLLAAKADRVDVMRALVAGGADASLKAQDGSTLLMAAAGSGRLDAVQYAWELDPHADAVTTAGDTVVHAAVSPAGPKPDETEMCKVIDFLAEKGAPLDVKDARGRTPINVADGPPFDKAVAEITRLVIKAGGVPTKSKNAP
jgi:ankyrin repeat protein